VLIDMHVHTTRGSTDSGLSPAELVAVASELDLDGVCITEHGGSWSDAELREVADGTGLALFSGREIETDVGHVLAIGLLRYEAGLHRFGALAEYAERNGVALVLAHPFRHHTNPPAGQSCLLTAGLPDVQTEVDALARAIPELSQVHAIEAANGATSQADNELAAATAGVLGCATTGGSDAHSVHGIGSGLTRIDGRPRTSAELAEAIRAGIAAAVTERLDKKS
jgi:predicted metal-dependent phosphoesterase TrpH